MSLLAIIVGLLIAGGIIWRLYSLPLNPQARIWGILLATFPVYYFVFSLYAADFVALGKELLVSIVFFSLVLWARRVRAGRGLMVLAVGYLCHAYYDFVHDSLFINQGTPDWWPEFCGAVDLILGLYLIWYISRLPACKT